MEPPDAKRKQGTRAAAARTERVTEGTKRCALTGATTGKGGGTDGTKWEAMKCPMTLEAQRESKGRAEGASRLTVGLDVIG